MSIILCTKGRPERLARAIDSIRASGNVGREAEIVVVEETAAPRHLPGVRYVALPPEGRGFGYARDVGVRAASGDILLFIDDDCRAERGWADHLVAPLEADPEVLGVAGAVAVRDCGPIGYAENILGFPGGGLRYRHAARGRVVRTRHLSTCNCAYRRAAIERAGGFPLEARRGGEDVLLAERVTALGPCVYAPAAVVYHEPRGSLLAITAWFVRRGASEIDLLRLSRDRRRLVLFLLRSSWTLRGLAAALLLVRWPWLLPWLPTAVAAWVTLVLFRFRFARRSPAHRRGWVLVPAVKLAMDLGTEIGRITALLSRRHR